MKNQDGFSLIELIIIISILSIVSIVALPKVNMNKIKVFLAARQVAIDLRYARNLAYTGQNDSGVMFSPVSYTLFENIDPFVPANNPVNGNMYQVAMAGKYDGITILYSKGLNGGIIRFSSLGEPLNSSGDLLEDEKITLKFGDLSVQVNIEGVTGHIELEKNKTKVLTS